MLFISAAHSLRIPRTRNRHTVTCRADSRAPRRGRRPADRDPPPPPRPARRARPSPRRSPGDDRVPSPAAADRFDTPSADIWDGPVDDHTSPETYIRQSGRPSLTESSEFESRVRNAARPLKQPKPRQNQSAATDNPPKKKRGRPRGSKSVNEASMPQPEISPFMLAIREDLRRRSIAANRDIMSGLFSAQSEDPPTWDDVQLSAPNGLPDADGNADLLQELLPIIAKQENEETRVVTDEEDRIKRLVSTCYTQFNSIHRFSDRLNNLKPYTLQKESEQECEACDGTGMTECEYCKGEGYVDLGENGEKFNPEYGNNVFTMPKHVTGNIYHCPLCGGLQQERCVSCFGTGAVRDGKEVAKGGSKRMKEERAWKVFDMNELIEREKDRIEIGLDGTIIMRAKRRGKNKKSKMNADKPVPRKRRGRPPKSTGKSDARAGTADKDGAEVAKVANKGTDVTSDLQRSTADTPGSAAIDIDESVIPSAPAVVVPPGRSVGLTTDFVNTTDYQVGRRLSRQSAMLGNDFQDEHKDSRGGRLPPSDQDGEKE